MAGSGDGARTMKRRGILAAAGVVVAGIVAKQAIQPVTAQSGNGNQGALILGSNSIGSFDSVGPDTPNVASAATDLQASPNFGNFITFGAYVFRADARPSVSGNIGGVEGYGRGTGTGVYGQTDNGTAVYGYGGSAGNGVVGVGGGTGSGVAGFGSPSGGARRAGQHLERGQRGELSRHLRQQPQHGRERRRRLWLLRQRHRRLRTDSGQ